MFERLEQMKNPGNNNHITFPYTDFRDFSHWTPGHDGEHVSKCRKTVVLNKVPVLDKTNNNV